MNMFQRIGLVARREFLVTVSSKGFLFGVLVMPFLITALLALVPRLLADRGAPITVEVAVIDEGRQFATALRGELRPEVIAAGRDAGRQQAMRQLGVEADLSRVAQQQARSLPAFTVTERPAGSTVTAERAWLTAEQASRTRRALVVIPAGAVRATGDTYSTYELYAPRNLPEMAENLLHGAVRQALVAERLRDDGIDAAVVKAATNVVRPRTVVLSADGRQQGSQGLNRAMPFVMGILLFMGVMIGGQALMTSTIEEKSSRVIEVLLAAVSPLELMWGKLLGQLGVGLITMSVYVALGVVALLQFALIGMLDPLLILYLFLFFLLTYLMFGALMQAIGAAVSQMADAQSLMGPLMVLMVVPYALTPVIGSNPDSAVAVAASFIPPVNGFAMLARLASASPPPVWQVLLSLLCGLAGACAAVWFAAKVFRVGLLMHGKPPSFGTLLKWVRMS